MRSIPPHVSMRQYCFYVPFTDVSSSAQNPSINLLLIIGTVAGLVRMLTITLLMIFVVPSVVLVRKCKPPAITKQPFYNYFTSPQPPT